MLPVHDKTSTKGKWETDLGCVYEEVDWHYLLEQAQTVLISTKHRQIQFNIFHRTYYTPYRLHKIDSNISSRCQRCKVTDGDLLHMLWSWKEANTSRLGFCFANLLVCMWNFANKQMRLIINNFRKSK